jgi:hypothetical protein
VGLLAPLTENIFAHCANNVKNYFNLLCELLNHAKTQQDAPTCRQGIVASFNEAMDEKKLLAQRGLAGWQLCAVESVGDCMTKHYFIRPMVGVKK